MYFYKLFALILVFAIVQGNHQYGMDISPEHMAELEILKNLTDQLVKENLTYEVPRDVIKYDNSDIYFYVYTQSSTNGTKLTYDESDQLSSVSGFSTDLRTVFIIHGWQNDYESDVNTLIRAALLAKVKVNIITVDWSSYSYLLYALAVSNVENVGKTVGLFIESLVSNYDYSPDNIILVGHSLGAHVAGFAGKELNGTLGVIVGMDPAGPLFFESSTDRLNVGDAQYVEAIHTNAQFLGVNYALGDTDFWPNGGYMQAGCLLSQTCSHSRSYIYMAESIEDNTFYARQCDLYDEYTDGACSANTLYLMGGLKFETSKTGNYYLNTSSSSPYGLGDIFGN
ncbi:pancreatic triacylglycerol lipase-like isoform X2 [Rhynchophorus ferrugineus]|uniref:pancreatic triacylglycerol lipase-like isoform X2 n=1 Tax=Rhynchophorus ferrugineus TaxID=354439 RepID=UPI003FCC9A8C